MVTVIRYIYFSKYLNKMSNDLDFYQVSKDFWFSNKTISNIFLHYVFKKIRTDFVKGSSEQNFVSSLFVSEFFTI
jgi:hypothetical protein